MNKLSINPYLFDYIPKDYASTLPEGEVLLDCSLGVNASLLGNCVFDRLHEFAQKTVLYTGNVAKVIDEGNYAEIKYYPHDDSLKEELAQWYHGHGVGEGWLTGDHFLLGNGSYDILCNINLLCLTNGRKVLGHGPQFTAYVDHVACTGSGYAAYCMDKDKDYAFEAEAYLRKMSEDYALFIVENPNNPTGQIIPLEDIEKIVKRAWELETVIVVDEAYAEYMPFSNSAVNLVDRFPNLIVTRSLSKGWGMAGIRLGYGVSAAHGAVLTQLAKLVLPFNSNALARTLVLTALRSTLENPDDPFGVEETADNKAKVMGFIHRKTREYGRPLCIAKTYEKTPIMLLCYRGREAQFDLQSHFMKFGLMTVSCATYEGLGPESVRLMIPLKEEIPLLLRLLESAIKTLPD